MKRVLVRLGMTTTVVLGVLAARAVAQESDARAAMDKLFEVDSRNQALMPDGGVAWLRCAAKVKELRQRPGAQKQLVTARKCVARTEALFAQGFRLIHRCQDVIVPAVQSEQAAAGSAAADEHRQAQRAVRSCSADLTRFRAKLEAHQQMVNAVSML
jgi:hypothetical protein